MRLPRPWDSPGKNTGVGCHFLLQCVKVKGESEVAQSCPTRYTQFIPPSPSPGVSASPFSGRCISNAVSSRACFQFFNLQNQEAHTELSSFPKHHDGTPASNSLFSSISHLKPEKAMAPHSSTLAWNNPWTEEPGGLQSMESLRVGHD